MVSRFRRRAASVGRQVRPAIFGSGLTCLLALAACDQLPLLAPSGSVITLIATSNVLAANGSVDIIATVIEQGVVSSGGEGGTTTTAVSGQGTPVHNGTLVTFTTTIGALEPREARTHNGQVTVRLTGDGRSGVAKVTAFSGGASGTIDINVGAAAAERVVVTGSPQQLPASGGTVQLSARIEDASGNGLGGVEVSFTTTAGTVSPPAAMSNEFGVASATLTTTQAAEVKASAGGKESAPFSVTLAARTGIAITPPSASPTAGLAASFGVSVSAAANVTNVTVDWGDGSTVSLGALAGSTTTSHVYAREGTYTVTATAIDTAGTRESVSTSVTVLPAPVVAVTVTASPSNPTVGQAVTFTASATPAAGTTVTGYSWDFGDGTGTTTSGGSASHVYDTSASFTVTVRVTTNVGSTGVGQTIVTVTTPALVTITVTASSTTPVIGQSVTFTASNSALPAGVAITAYSWNFGDGSPVFSGGNVVSHIYATAAVRDITVVVSFSNGTSAVGQTTITVTPAPPVSVAVSAVPSSVSNTTGGNVLFTATPSTLPPGAVVVRYEWIFGDGTGTVTTTGNTTTHAYLPGIGTGTKTVTVTVVLSNGVTGAGFTIITVTT